MSSPPADHLGTPTGPYFFYGTLMDPKMLSGMLHLDREPTLRPAKITGFSCKLWGPYPALQEGPPDATVQGAVYHVQSVADGKRLAKYETNHYKMKPCLIQYTDGAEPAEDEGHVYVFAGDPRDLKEGTFDLDSWLERMGRRPVPK